MSENVTQHSSHSMEEQHEPITQPSRTKQAAHYILANLAAAATSKKGGNEQREDRKEPVTEREGKDEESERRRDGKKPGARDSVESSASESQQVSKIMGAEKFGFHLSRTKEPLSQQPGTGMLVQAVQVRDNPSWMCLKFCLGTFSGRCFLSI